MLTCTISGCTRDRLARGWCELHYRRWRRHGDPGPAGTLRDYRPVARREWVQKLAQAAPTGKCVDWPWPLIGDKPRPYLWLDGRHQRVSRLVLVLAGHPEPPAPRNYALHSCDRPICCAPWHLRWGTLGDNSQDMHDRGRARGRQRGFVK